MKEVKLIKQNAMMKIMVGDELLEPAGYMTYNVDGDQFGAMEEMGNRIVFFGAYATDMTSTCSTTSSHQISCSLPTAG